MQTQQLTAESITAPEEPCLNHPKGLYVLSIAEMFERFSYYGMRSLLVLYMISKLQYGDKLAYSVFGLYASLVYASPIIGGYLADKVIGFQRAVILGSLIIASGHLCMALSVGEPFLYIGLGLIIAGTGFFKSNVSAMVGMLYKKNDQLLDAGYTLFYMGINLGGFLAPLICGYLSVTYGWEYGFGLASIGMITGALILITQRHHFEDIGLHKSSKSSSFRWVTIGGILSGPLFAGIVYFNDLFKNILPLFGLAFLLYLFKVALNCTAQERRNILALVIAILLLLLSGGLVEQTAMALTLFVERNVDRSIFGFTIPTTFFHSIDPLTVLLFGGLFSQAWIARAKKGKDFQASTKYIIAFMLMGLAYLIFYLGCESAGTDGLSALIYPALAMVLLSMGDICMYPVTLSLCSRLSPKNLQGVLMGGVMMGVAFSQLFCSMLASFASLPEDVNNTMIDLALTSSLYGNFFQSMAWIAGECILLTILAGFWMKRLTSHS